MFLALSTLGGLALLAFLVAVVIAFAFSTERMDYAKAEPLVKDLLENVESVPGKRIVSYLRSHSIKMGLKKVRRLMDFLKKKGVADFSEREVDVGNGKSIAVRFYHQPNKVHSKVT